MKRHSRLANVDASRDSTHVLLLMTTIQNMESKEPKTPKKRNAEQKLAMSRGREQSAIVKNYLEYLAANKPKRGRKRTASSIQLRLAKIESELAEATPLSRLHLVQEKIDLATELEQLTSAQSIESIEAEFIKVAAEYGERKGISYQAWKEAGISPEILRKAGIQPSR